MKLLARVADAKGAPVFKMPGGRPAFVLPYGTILPLSGQGMKYRGIIYFPVQVEMTILWASEVGFAIIRKR